MKWKVFVCVVIIWFVSMSLFAVQNTQYYFASADETSSTSELTEPNPLATMNDECKRLSKIDENYGYFNDIYIQQLEDSLIAFVAVGVGGLLILDISNPQSPHFISQYSNCTEIRLVHVENNIAYLIQGIGELLLLDISQLSNPTKIAPVDISVK